MRTALVALVLVLGLLVGPAPVAAQDPDGVEVPTQDIVPEPDSGRPPAEAGDRGGALQLMILGLVLATVGGATWHLVRQSRRARQL